MPNTAPGTERLAGGVKEDAAPAAKARPAARWRRWAGAGVFLLIIVVLFDAFLHLSKTYPENSDEANILLMANDMLHGNVLLHNWSVSDVPFITTELPQIALLVWMFGLHLNTAHIAAAVTYTLVVAVAMLLAKGKAHGWAAVARMALALGIMLAPQPGVGIFVVVFSVGHIGTALPVMLTWLVLDRLGRKWYVPLIVAVLLGWALAADPLVFVVAILPLLAVCLVRVVSALALGAAKGGGIRGLRAAALDRWFEVWLAAAAGIGYAIAWGAGQFISSHAGYHQQAVPYEFNWPQLFMQSRIVVHGLLEMFGAYFVPWVDTYIQWPVTQPAMSGLDQAIALTHLVGVIFAVWGACAIAWRFFFRDADIVSQLLLAGIVANIGAYVPSTLAHHTALNVREIAPVLPFAAVLAGRMIGDRLVRGPVWTVGVPGFLRLPRVVRDRRPADGALADGALTDGAAARANGARSPRRTARLRLVAIPLVALLGWYSYGLFLQTDTPAAPEPLTQVAAFLEGKHLSYGVGGYWDSSVITVETGGAVTIRAVTPACLQPYQWESKADWYDPTQHVANFVLLSNVNGYFTKFAANGSALYVLNVWADQPPYTKKPIPPSYASALYKGFRWPANLYQGVYYQPIPGSSKPIAQWYYSARVYPFNLLTEIPQLPHTMSSPPHWLVEYQNGQPLTAC